MDTTGTNRREYLAMPVEERPHLYPDKPSSNTTYNGWGENLGCRCSLCTEAHRVAAREYLEAKIAGTWTDRRKTGKTRGLIHDLAEIADRYPELNTMLQRYGHRPVVIQIEPESVVEEPIPTEATGGPETPETATQPTLAITQVPASVESGAAETAAPEPPDELENDQKLVLGYCATWANPASGQILPAMDNLEVMSSLLHIAPGRCEAAAVALVQDGRLRNDKTGLYLADA